MLVVPGGILTGKFATITPKYTSQIPNNSFGSFFISQPLWFLKLSFVTEAASLGRVGHPCSVMLVLLSVHTAKQNKTLWL